MGTASSKHKKDKKGKKGTKNDPHHNNALRDIHRPPQITLPKPLPLLPMFTYWKTVPFLPQTFMTNEEWTKLQKDAEHYGVTTFQIYELFLRLCSPYDISYGTVQLRKFFREFDPRFRKVLRRLIVKLADGHPRILFEDIVRFIFEFCGMDFYNLIIKSVAAVREFDVMNIITVRALVRYINGDRDMDEFTRSVLAHLHADPPFHHVSAFVQLCVRYPVLVYPIILMQRSMQRRFFGLKFWREYMKRTGNQLFPPDFSKVDAEMITARVILLESVSLSAVPFQFGTSKTATDPPKEFLEQEMRKWNKRKKRLLLQQQNSDGFDPTKADTEEEDDNNDDDEYDKLEGNERDKFLNDFGGSKRNIDLQHGEIDLYSIRNEQIAATAALVHQDGEKMRINGKDTHEVLGFLSLASPMVTKSLANRRISFGGTDETSTATGGHDGGGGGPPVAFATDHTEEEKTLESTLDTNPLFHFNFENVMKDIDHNRQPPQQPVHRKHSTTVGRRGSQNTHPALPYDNLTTVAINSPVNRDDSTTTGGRRTSITHGRDRRRASLIVALNSNNTGIWDTVGSNGGGGGGNDNGGGGRPSSAVSPTAYPTLSPSSSSSNDPYLTNDTNNGNRRSSVRRNSVLNNGTNTALSPSHHTTTTTNDTNDSRKMENYLHEKLYVQPLLEQQNRRISVPKSQTIVGGFGLGVTDHSSTNTVTNNNTTNVTSPGTMNRPASSSSTTTTTTTTGRRGSVTLIPTLPGTVDTPSGTHNDLSTTHTTTTTATSPAPPARNRRHSLLLPNAHAANTAFQAALEFEKISGGTTGTSVDTMMNQRKAAILRKGITNADTATLSPTAVDSAVRKSSVVLPGSIESPPPSTGATNPIAARRRQSLIGTLGGTNVVSPGTNVTSPVVIVDATSPGVPSVATTGPTGNRVSSANATLTAAAKARRASVMFTGGILPGMNVNSEGNNKDSTNTNSGGNNNPSNNWLSNLQSSNETTDPNSTPNNNISTTSQTTSLTTTETSSLSPSKSAKTVRIMDEPLTDERKEESLPPAKPVFDLSDKLQQLQDKAEKPLTETEKMRIVNNLANQSIDNLNEKSQVLVLQNFDTNAKFMFDQGYSAVDTRLRLAAFGFSGMMGNNNAQLRKDRIETTSNKILPIPVPPKVSEYVLEHPHPAGTVCKLTSLQISKIALAHVNSGAGQLYGIVRVPCLLCNRTVLHVDDLIAEEAEEELLEQQLAEEAEEEARRLAEEEEEDNDNDSYYGDEDDDDDVDDYEDTRRDGKEITVHHRSRAGRSSGTSTNEAYEPEYRQEYTNDAHVAGEDRAEGRKIATVPPEHLNLLHRKHRKASQTSEASLAVSTATHDTTGSRPSVPPSPSPGDDSSTLTSPGNVPTSASNTLVDPSGTPTDQKEDDNIGYYMERDDTSDIDGYQRKDDPTQFVVDKKYRIGNRKKKGKSSDVVRERMAKFWAKEAEIKRRVALIKRQQDKLSKEEARIKAEKEAALGTINTVTVNNQILDNNEGIDDDLEDTVVKVITDKALHDPYAITLVTGSAPGALAGTRKPNTEAPPSSLVAAQRPSKLSTDEKTKKKGNGYDDDDDEEFSDASSSYYEIASVARDSVAEAEREALEHAERVAIARERLAKEQIFAKATAKNTGLCGECDLYCRRVASHLFGYKIAYRLLETATVKPSVDDELNRHTQRARQEGHPLVQGKPMDDEEILEMQRKMELMKQAALLSAQETNEDGSISVEALAAQAQLANTANSWKRIERDIYEFPDDNYIELYDDDSKRFFYYNVTVGESQWHKPKKYLAYKDRETRKEEELIEQQAQKELMKLELLKNKAAKSKVQTSLGQRQDKSPSKTG